MLSCALGIGVKQVWLVDLDLRQILVSHPGGAQDIPHDSTLVWRSPEGRELNIDIPDLFRGLPRVVGEASVSTSSPKPYK